MSKKHSIILGISCFYHDSAAALLLDGVVVAAAQEERFTRKKHDADFPENAVRYCLESQGLSIEDVDYVVFYDKPITKFGRLLETYIKVWPRGLRSFLMAMQAWLKEKLWVEQLIAKRLKYSGSIFFTEHHYSHAASAYYASNFNDAVVVTMDGVGEWDTTTVGYGEGNTLRLTQSIAFPHSLGLLYSALTYYLGFKVNSAEYKVMGLAPYGNPETYIKQMRELVVVLPDGSYELNMKYFSYEYGTTMTNKKFDVLFGASPRLPEFPLEQRHKDIAAALQKVTEDIVLKIMSHASKLHPSKNVCLAGGVALNCVANGKILEAGMFEHIYIQPASGDAGGAIGAACYVYYDVLGNKKKNDVMKTAYLGPDFTNEEIKKFLSEKKENGSRLVYKFYTDEELYKRVAKLVSDDHVVGLFQGRMEFGPRSLGNRSIIADARNKENWQRVNLKIKFRESFRPFAPSVLAESADDYFSLQGGESPYMLLVASVKKDTIPAVTHVDGSARVQTVRERENPRYWNIMREFEALTGCPVIINTSFNVRGEPIVCTPEDAFRCFINTDIDDLVLGNCLISKSENLHLNKSKENKEYLKEFELD